MFKIGLEVSARPRGPPKLTLPPSPEQGPFKVGCMCKAQANSRAPCSPSTSDMESGGGRGEAGERRWEFSNDLL